MKLENNEINYELILKEYNSKMLLYCIFFMIVAFISIILIGVSLFDKDFGNAIGAASLFAISLYFNITYYAAQNSMKKRKKKRGEMNGNNKKIK